MKKQHKVIQCAKCGSTHCTTQDKKHYHCQDCHTDFTLSSSLDKKLYLFNISRNKTFGIILSCIIIGLFIFMAMNRTDKPTSPNITQLESSTAKE